MSTHNSEAILMSTHNISSYKDLTNIIFELSSNIIIYICTHLISSSAIHTRVKIDQNMM